jgi:hypothetical protein
MVLVTSGLTAQVATLSPIRDFDLSTCLSSSGPPITHAFAVTSSGMYFLISPPGVFSQYIVITDPAGRCRQTIPLPERVSPHFLAAGSDGEMSVLKRHNAQKVERLTLNSTGNITSRVVLSEPASQLVSAGTGFIGASLTADVYLYNQHGQATKQLSPSVVSDGLDPLYLIAVSEPSFLLVNGKVGSAQLIDSESGLVRPISIAPQETAAARAVYSAADQSKAVVITSAASRGDAYAYLSLSGIRLAEGALILKIDQTGAVIQSFRCSLPARPENGFMTPR